MHPLSRSLFVLIAAGVLAACSGSQFDPDQRTFPLGAAPVPGAVRRGAEVMVADHDESPPLAFKAPAARTPRVEHEPIRIPRRYAPFAGDAALQVFIPSWSMPSGSSWEGAGVGLQNYTDNGTPPDTNGDVGLNDYVEGVNTDLVVFDKASGAIRNGFPEPFNTVWKGSSVGNGLCSSTNQGDPVVLYDQAADRWFISQFAFSVSGQNPVAPYYQCVAVSKTGDPVNGGWNLYAFGPMTFNGGSAFNDYGKMGVWSDAYYATYNMFPDSGSTYGVKICAMDRASMLAGGTATQQCVDVASVGGLLPADIDGPTAPPAGSPETIVGFDTNVVQTWQFHVDWTTPSNTALSGPNNVTVSSFNMLNCSQNGCVPITGGNMVDALSDRMMFRAAYRNFGTYESLVGNFTVDTGSASGVRWFELRNAPGKTLGGATPILHQDGTYAPADGLWRWLGSIAQDASGNMALGFSASSSSSSPSIRWAGRLAGDPVGTMAQGEGTVATGTGSTTYGRWGDYSDMTVDPSDDCTFYYANEFLDPETSGFAWRTKIGHFKFASCTGGGGGATHYGVTGPSSVNAGNAATYTVQALDGSNAVVTTYSGTATITSTDAAASLPSSVSFTNGVGTMSVTLRSGGSQTITATDASSSSITGSVSVTVNVTTNPATHYQLSGLSPSTQAGVAKTVTVTALDSGNAVAGSYAGSAHLTSTDSAATLSPSTLNFTAGVAMAQVTFATMGAQTLTATDLSTSSITGTANTTVTGGPAATYVLTGLDAGVAKNTNVNLTVTARDAAGNVASYTGTANVTSSDSAATLPSTVTFTAGVANATVKFGTLGTQTVTFTDASSASLTVTGSTVVAAGAPTVNITAPADGSTVHGTVIITAVANGLSGAGISAIEIDVDGTKLQSGTSGSLAAQWDTTKVANGAHKLTAKATDTNSVSATSKTVNVTVSNTKSSGASTPGCGCGTSSPAELAALGLGLALFLRRRRFA